MLKRTTSYSLYKPWTPYLYLAPALILLLIFVFWPISQAFIYSFQEYNIFTPPKWIGVKNFTSLFRDSDFLDAFKHTFLYYIGVVPPLIILPLLIAVLVNYPLRGVKIVRVFLYFPVVTSMVVAGIAWKWIYAEAGILNYVLLDVLHVVNEPVHWLTSEDTALGSVMAVTIWKGLGYYMVIYLAGLQAIPKEFYEAATIDGANSIVRFCKITLPLMIPSMTVVGVMSSIAALKVFDEIFVMTGGGPYNSSKTVVFKIYDNIMDVDIGYACAMGFVLFFVILLFSIIGLKISEKKYEI